MGWWLNDMRLVESFPFFIVFIVGSLSFFIVFIVGSLSFFIVFIVGSLSFFRVFIGEEEFSAEQELFFVGNEGLLGKSVNFLGLLFFSLLE
jgi:hypothetical protein